MAKLKVINAGYLWLSKIGKRPLDRGPSEGIANL